MSWIFLMLLLDHFLLISCTAAISTEASAMVIDGKSIAKEIRHEITTEISRMKDEIGVIPGLAVILVGARKDSTTYVRNKKKACESVGIKSYEVCLPEDSTEEEVLKFISGFNDDPEVHGILVQLPLPSVCFESENHFCTSELLRKVITSFFILVNAPVFTKNLGNYNISLPEKETLVKDNLMRRLLLFELSICWQLKNSISL